MEEDRSILEGFYLPCHVCDTALKKDEGTRKCCSAFRKIYYCSKECQIAHWPAHKAVCKQLRASKALPTLSQMRKGKAIRDDILFGSGSLSERVKWCGMDPSDPDTPRVQRYLDNLDRENLHAFSATKWITTSLRGAVLFDLDAPLPTAANVDVYPWITWNGIQLTYDRRMQEVVKGYDPAYQAPVFIYSIDQPGRSLKMWTHTVSTGNLPVCLRLDGDEISGSGPVAWEILRTKTKLKNEEWKYVIKGMTALP